MKALEIPKKYDVYIPHRPILHQINAIDASIDIFSQILANRGGGGVGRMH